MEAQEWDQRYRESELMWGAAPNRFVVAEVEGLPPGRALDVAAGEGRNAVWLAERGWRVTASEFSTVAIERGTRIAQERGVEITWVHADVRDHEPEAASYDLVLLAYLHLPRAEWTRALANSVRALAPGGRLVSIGHDRDNLVNGVGGPQDPDVLHDTDELTGDLADVTADLPFTLHVRRAERVRREVTVEGHPRTAIDTIVVAIRNGEPYD